MSLITDIMDYEQNVGILQTQTDIQHMVWFHSIKIFVTYMRFMGI